MFDLTNRESFNGIKKWIEELELKAPKDIKIILAGNKSDLVISQALSIGEIKDFANSLNINFYLVSAKENININEIFQEIAYEIMSKPQLNDDRDSMRNSVHISQFNKRKKRDNCC